MGPSEWPRGAAAAAEQLQQVTVHTVRRLGHGRGCDADFMLRRERFACMGGSLCSRVYSLWHLFAHAANATGILVVRHNPRCTATVPSCMTCNGRPVASIQLHRCHIALVCTVVVLDLCEVRIQASRNVVFRLGSPSCSCFSLTADGEPLRIFTIHAVLAILPASDGCVTPCKRHHLIHLGT